MTKAKEIDTQKRGGRPRLEKYEQRRHQHKVTYNDTEEDTLQYKAKENNRSVTEWLHDAPLQTKGKPHLSEEQNDYVRKIAGMGNNVNQIAHVANREGLTGIVERCTALLNDLSMLLSRLFRGGDLTVA